VASIILFQSFIYDLLDFKNYMADQIWKLTALSIAAQIGTFPLSILYFHQFPNYFILTNLLVVPLAAVILYLAIAMVFLFWIPHLSALLAWILKISLKGMIFSVMQVEHLPFSVMSNIYFNNFQLVFLYMVILFVACFLHLRSKKFLFAAVFSFSFFIISLIARDLINYRNQFFIVFQQKGASVMMAAKRSNAIVLYSGKNPKLRMQAFNLAKGVGLERRIKTIEMMRIDSLQVGKLYSALKNMQVYRSRKNLVLVQNGDQHIAWLKAESQDQIVREDSIQTDVLVLANLRQANDCGPLKRIIFRHSVFDSSCKPALAMEKSKFYSEKGIIAHDVATSGAFLLGF
jgi:competence protein ComEC